MLSSARVFQRTANLVWYQSGEIGQMPRSYPRRHFATILLAMALALTNQAAAQSTYTFKVIDYPGALGTTLTGVNDLGQVVGYAGVSNSDATVNFVYSGNAFATVVTPPGATSTPLGINNAGQILMQVYCLNTSLLCAQPLVASCPYAFALYNTNNSTWSPLPGYFTLTPSGPFYGDLGHGGLNNNGQIVVSAIACGNAAAGPYAYIYQSGSWSPILWSGNTVSPYGINDLGQIVGEAYTDQISGNGLPNNFGGFIYGAGAFTFLDDVPGFTGCLANAAAVNNIAAIVGLDGCDYARLYSGGASLVLPPSPLLYSGGATRWGYVTPTGINNLQQVVGNYRSFPDGQQHGYVAGPSATPQPLTITTTALPSAASGQPYTASIEATGGSGAGYVWSVVAGSVPPGFTLSGGGVLGTSGDTDAPVSSYGFTVEVTDSGGNAEAQPLTLVVGPPPPGAVDDKSLGACACPVGNPIDVGSGNKYEAALDYQTSTPNKLSFARYYNGLASSKTFALELGNNWRSTFDRYLHVTSSAGAATAISAERANGQGLSFTKSGSNWISDTDVDVELVQTGTATWTLTDHDDTVETYTVNSSGEGLLNTIVARNRYTQTLQYNAGNQLTSVNDSYGRAITLTYANGLLKTVTTPDGLVMTYGYTAATGGSQLTSVSYSTTPAASQTYVYENSALPFALTGIIDEDGNRYATWSYDSYGRGLSSQHAGGTDLTTISYDDTTGNRTVTNALGEQMLYKFTTLQGVPKVTEIDRLATSSTAAATKLFTYDANGYTASVTDWNGNLTTYVNDVHGQPTTITEASGTAQTRITTISYLTNYHLPASIATPGLTTTYTYDASGNLLTKTDTDTTTTAAPYSTKGTTRTTTYTWANSLPASMQGPRTDVKELTTYTYDASGALTATINAVGQKTKITKHLPGGLPQTIVDPNGVTTNLTYDARNRLLSSTVVTGAGSLVTGYAYDAAGNLLTVTQPDGSSLTNTYDAAHRLTAITDLLNNTTQYTLDALGDRTLTSILNPSSVLQRKHAATFDGLGRLLTDVGGVGQTTTYAYDSNGNATNITDPLSRIITQVFDSLNRRTQITDPGKGVTSTTYDAHNRPITVTDPNGNTTGYVYDGFGDVIQQTSPDTGTTVYRYDQAGNLVNRVDAAGAITNYAYDALDRMTLVEYPGRNASQNVLYNYDQASGGFGVGRLTSVQDAAGTLSRTYDERGNVLGEKRALTGATLATSYTWDTANRLASIGYPSGWITTYSRDTAGRVTGVTAQSSAVNAKTQALISGIAYEAFGPANTMTYGNSVNEKSTFDLDYRLTALTDTGTSTFQKLTYGYDAASNVLSIADGVTAANSQTLAYDKLDRLTSATGSYGSLGYTYDPVGNRLTQTAGATTTTYAYTAKSNRLASIAAGGSTQTIGYTPDGNISSMTQSGTQPTDFTYNEAGRLATVEWSGQDSAAYTYDAFGHRLVKRSATVKMYQYDLGGHLAEETDNQGNPLVDYVYLGDRPIATISPSNGKVYFLLDDRLGTPQVATDANQVVQWTASYQPFGYTSTGVGLIVQDLRLPGQEFDVETGFYHNGFRDYVPGLGRYLESDPIGVVSDLNTYRYARGNPFRLVDRRGAADTPVVDFVQEWRELMEDLATIERELAVSRVIAGGNFNVDFSNIPAEYLAYAEQQVAQAIPQAPPAAAICSASDPRGLGDGTELRQGPLVPWPTIYVALEKGDNGVQITLESQPPRE